MKIRILLSYKEDEFGLLKSDYITKYKIFDINGEKIAFALAEHRLKRGENPPEVFEYFQHFIKIYRMVDSKREFVCINYPARLHYRMYVRCYEDIIRYKEKYSALKNDIVTNGCRIFGFRRFRYCNNEMAYTMPFALWEPRNKGGQKLPLLIFLHGKTNGGETNITPFTECLNTVAKKIKRGKKKNPCIMIVPSIPKCYGYDISVKSDDKTMFDAIFNELFPLLKEKYPIDENRVYLMGSSNGAGGTWSQIIKHPERYAAAIPMMGFSDADEEKHFETIKDIAVWAVHAENDDNVVIGKSEYGVDGSDILVEKLKAAGNCKVKYSRYKKYGHRVAKVFLKNENWYDWLFEQKK